MQDEIVARLANALDTQLIVAEARRAERAPNPNSMDLYFQGMSAYNQGAELRIASRRRAGFSSARSRSIPNNVDAIVGGRSRGKRSPL